MITKYSSYNLSIRSIDNFIRRVEIRSKAIKLIYSNRRVLPILRISSKTTIVFPKLSSRGILLILLNKRL